MDTTEQPRDSDEPAFQTLGWSTAGLPNSFETQPAQKDQMVQGHARFCSGQSAQLKCTGSDINPEPTPNPP